MDRETTTDSSSTTQSTNPLSRKLSKILETRLENDKELLDSLKSLSVFFDENNIRTRRNLRSDIERRSLTINEEFVNNFKEVKQQLDDVYKNVKAMNSCCEDMSARLKTAKAETHDLINQTTTLQAESQKLSLRAQVVDAFISRFQLNPNEVQALRGTRDGVLHPDFFTALQRVQSIHSDCKVLLRTNQQATGLEIMESMALQQESSYERLYRWTQNQCRSLSGDSPEIPTRLCQAMAALQERPLLFRYSLDEFGTARRAAIVRGLIDALTRGGPGGTPRPIELHAHDPLRYSGDMLAWLHQGAASEKEHLNALLAACSKTQSAEDAASEVLSHVTEGVCRPLKVRVEQVVVSEPGSVVLYRLANLLKFYHGTISNFLPTDAALLSTLSELRSLCMKMFQTSLQANSSKLLDKIELPSPSLGPVPALTQTLQLVQDLFSSHDSSVLNLDSRREDFGQILTLVIEPLIQMCSYSASSLSTVDMATYMINCLHLMHTTLSLYEFTEERLEMLQAQMDAHVDTLVSEQAGFILSRAGLSHLYGVTLQHRPSQGPLSNIHGMDGINIKTAMNQFDTFLASPDRLIMPQCALLSSATQRDLVKDRSVSLLLRAYTLLYEAVLKPENDYREPRSLMPRTPEQVKDLLG